MANQNASTQGRSKNRNGRWSQPVKATFHSTEDQNTDEVSPVKEGRNSRDGNYSFEFCPLHAAHA